MFNRQSSCFCCSVFINVMVVFVAAAVVVFVDIIDDVNVFIVVGILKFLIVIIIIKQCMNAFEHKAKDDDKCTAALFRFHKIIQSFVRAFITNVARTTLFISSINGIARTK